MARQKLEAFAEDTYLHQVMARTGDGKRKAFKDLGPALEAARRANLEGEEWRIHFHVPLHSRGTDWYETTSGHVLGVLDWLKAAPERCSHLEMETYTWEVLPAELKARDLVDQLVAEYDWTLARLAERGLAEVRK